jgi:hypothetical protein
VDFREGGEVAFSQTRRHMTCGQIHLLAYLEPQAAAAAGWLARHSMSAVLSELQMPRCQVSAKGKRQVSNHARPGSPFSAVSLASLSGCLFYCPHPCSGL